jgi:hypothetical protein
VFGCRHKRLYRCSRKKGQKVHGSIRNPPASTSHVGFRCIVPGRRNGNDRTLRASFASGRFALRRDDSITTTGGPCR